MSRNLILTLAFGAVIAFAVTTTASVTATTRDTDASATAVKAGFKVAQKQGKGDACKKGTRWDQREKRCVPTG